MVRYLSVLLCQHHCRKCGYVVCSGCSTKRYLLPQIASRPIRVCDNCLDTLNVGQSMDDSDQSYQDRDSSGEDDDDEDDEDEESHKAEEEEVVADTASSIKCVHIHWLLLIINISRLGHQN
ncbi:Pleckstrin-like protein domain-containing family F member 2 [Apostichopus japonicus]|uniref:Pleckstrin-like protein domain-containing family F member 2 n=1 Tax=Stichopus japonicus TaxID=307972 RepID=A0A2G8KM45_STIJA|nr:Pleckstrin-like protein domain-containing family F member 2 [Apostichopus japonicus]